MIEKKVTKMLNEERKRKILELTNLKGSISINDLMKELGASESTVRRDLSSLDERGLIKKVHGGAIALDESPLNLVEQDMEAKSKIFTEEKIAIARFASSLIDDGDFVFIDAGTTTEKMIDVLPDKNVTFVTNAFVHA